MSHTSSVFSRIPIELPNRSGFDMSHENLGTATCGTLIPVLVDELLPNDTISLGSNFQVQLPPMATDFYGRVDFVLEAFFCPARLLWGGWKSFMTHPTANPVYPANTAAQGRSRFMPRVRITPVAQGGDSIYTELNRGSLADYLGFKGAVRLNGVQPADAPAIELNALPFLAYHRIWDDWYRDSRIQSPLFYAPDSRSSIDALTGINAGPSYAPYVSGGEDAPFYYTRDSGFVDSTNIFTLRQRNWSKDYYTSASPLPQAGNAATLEFDVSDDQGTFSIAALRSANSLQKWMERNNIMGYRYADQIFGQYGTYPSDAIMDKCLYLGRVSQNVYTRSVFQTNNNASIADTAAQARTSNPFKSVAAKYGSSQAIGEGSLVDNIRVKEHGFLVVLASLVPHSYYSTGVRRYLRRSVVGDIAFPLLSGMGEQAIMKSELSQNNVFDGTDSVFGYNDLYAEYKYHDDEVHGLLVDGESLDSFALQRSFVQDPALSSSFLQIPMDFLKQVMAYTSTEIAFNYDCWYDIFFPYKKVSTLPEYSVPTLGDLKNVHSKKVSRGGTRL